MGVSDFLEDEYDRITADHLQPQSIKSFGEDSPFFSDLFKGRCWPVVTSSFLNTTTQGLQFDMDKNIKQGASGSISFITDIDEELENITNPAEQKKAPVIYFLPEHKRVSNFISLQKWRGTVLKVYQDCFLSRLVDIQQDVPDEEAEIYLDEISDEDLSLIEPGSVFYWSIGYHIDPSGQRKRSSIIRFRRLPEWRTEEIEKAQKRAEQIRTLLGAESSNGQIARHR